MTNQSKLAVLLPSVLMLSSGLVLAQAPASRGSLLSVSDLNTDGRPDIVSCSKSTGTVKVLLGAAAGGYTTRTQFVPGGEISACGLFELNGDGKRDLVILDHAQNQLITYLGSGDGAFDQRKAIDTGAGPASFIIEDINQDGKPDAVVANTGGGTVTVLYGKGSGEFTLEETVTVPATEFSVAVKDFNLDGSMDIVVVNDTGDAVAVMTGSPSGKFTVVPIGGAVAPAAGEPIDAKGKPDAEAKSTKVGTTRQPQLTGLTPGGILYGNTDGTETQDSELFYDQTNNRIGLQTSAPAASIEVGNAPNAGSRVMQFTPAETASTPFAWTLAGFPNPGDTRLNQVLRFGWNLNLGGGQINYTDGALGLEFESHYAPNTNRYFEHHLTYVSPQGLVHRPISWMINKGTNFIEGSIRSNKFSFYSGGVAPTMAVGDLNGPPVTRDFGLKPGANPADPNSYTQWMFFKPNEIQLIGPSALVHNTNNQPFFYQMNGTANGFLPLMLVNPQDRVVVAPKGGPVRIPGTLNVGSVEDVGISRTAANTLTVTNASSGLGNIRSKTSIVAENATTPTSPAANAEANIYVKGGKLVVQYNDNGLVRYKSLDLKSDTVDWSYSTTAP